MHIRSRPAFFSLLMVLALTGCTSTPKSAENDTEDPAVTANAPLGSRIKRRTEANPVSQANRQQFEQERAQQGAIQAGVFNDPNRN